MSLSTMLSIVVYIVPTILVYSLIQFVFSLKRNRTSTWKQVRNYFDMQKGKLVEVYTNNDLEDQFEEAGLIQIGVTPFRYRMIRDVLALLSLTFIHFKFFITPEMLYPRNTVLMIVLVYLALIIFQNNVLNIIFAIFKKQYDRKKNSEIFILQQIISNEYSNTNGSKQNVYHMFMYMRKFLKYIQPAVDAFIVEYSRNPMKKETAFLIFAKKVGTLEAESLADILYQCDQASPEEIKEILQKRYEELRTKRQQNYRSMMKDRGVISYVLLFSGVLAVLISAATVYYMEYKDLVGQTFNLQ